MEVPNIVVTASQICSRLPRRVVIALPFDQVLPSSVVGLAAIQYALELPLLGLLAFVGPCDDPAAVGPDVRLGLVLSRDAVAPAVLADTRDMEGVENLHVGWEL